MRSRRTGNPGESNAAMQPAPTGRPKRWSNGEERAALVWLEEQLPPAIFASDYTSRTTPDVFVPPNDFQTPRNELHRQKWYRDFLARGRRPPEKGGHERIWKRALSTFPESRQRKERRFPVARPDDPVMALLWPVTPESTVFDALNALAGCIGYVGHSASLARCRFLLVTGPAHRYPARSARRRVYPGRLRELERAHRTNPVRPVTGWCWKWPIVNPQIFVLRLLSAACCDRR